ncbi:Muscle M-line assembly protein unc-89 [Toxocara canis]|uniref:Muscle M-line assembly protein unc-89 n=1 Tax=Toxocara canis TaxID=6265 RepID=A0A0B2VBC2_TOXCA|nr:Muscle M-line assembly protein unc-89 [Toxocara canis]
MVHECITIVGRTLLDSLVAGPSSTQQCTEHQVQVFVKQLLTALKFMHDKKIAHLDLRPEAILLQDDHLRLADFGQSRRLVRGKVAANIMGSPEFVSPEIAAGTPATLASDMWSVGTLTYVLLSGISPFLGESDTETIRNVMHANYSLDISELAPITDEAKDFISKLLVLDPRKRLTVDDALNHRWLAVPFLEEAKLASDCLREFKYRHKWLERRVFVQQTPSEQLISPVQGPDVHLASALQRTTHGLARSEPCNIYDYLRIKDPVTLPSDDASFPITQRSPMNATLTKDRNRLSVDEKLDGSTLSGGHQKAGTADEQMPPLRLVRGEHRAIEEEIANRILSDISEENSIASTDEVELGTRSAKEPKRPRQRKSRSRSSTPNAEGYSQETTPLISPALTIESVETTSHQQFFPDSAELLHHPGQLDPKVPVGAPLFLEELSRPHALVLQGQDSPQHSSRSLSPRSPRSLPGQDSPQHSSRSLSPRSPRSLPGTKSPVVLSPGKEYSMEVIIATKMGVPQVAQPHFETAGEIPPKLVPSESEKQKAKPSVHEDEFNSLINQIEMMKERRRKEREEMEKYRPKNIYREDIEFERPKIDEDDFPWESNYQIGPETFLLATRGAAFNARVRDYRRELWGDGAPFVTEGILGFRNQDISVRERRRFTDLVREDADIARSVDNLDRDMRGSRSGAVRRIQSDISKLEPTPTRKDGTFGAIFKRRLKDVAFTEGATEAIFECEVIGNPRPNVVWFYHESAISDDGKYKVIIATKMGVPQVAQPHFETAGEIPPKLVPSESEKQKAKPSVHEDEFNSLINQIEMMKERRRKEREEMEKYRPKNIYREDIEFERPKIDEDDFPWESNYQIGPETFLLATRGAAFNARVRDYRRELWGDGAPFVTEGILGFRNQDISVRERRRFTDLVREDADIARSVDNLDRDMRGSRSGAVRRIQSDISKLEPTPTRKDGTFGAIFKRRLKDVAFTEGATEAIFECEVIGNPRPNVVWFYHESAISDDGKYKMIIDGDVYRLRIDRVSLADLGEYSCTATNENGTDRTTARLLAGDTPGRTGRPEIELSSDTEVFITWEAPSMSSCLEGYTYKLEMRPAGENDHFSEWRLVSNEIDEEAVVVRHLSPLGVYQFRVTAKNAFGWGAPSLTSRIIRTHPKGSPKLQTDILKQQYHLCVLSKPAKLQHPAQSLGGIAEEDEDETPSEVIQTKILAFSVNETEDPEKRFQQQYHLCVLSKPAKLQHPAQSLGGIAEEDEDETPSEVIQTKILAFSVNETEDPEKRFQLGSELWRGRFSLILNSNDTRAEIGQKCAAKIMQYSSEDQQSLREFEALKECQHENVLHLIAAYRKGDIMYLFTEKLHEDIFERFTYNDYYNEEQISRSVAQIAAALHWIHFKGIAHLDVRPSNIMFVSRRSWQLKLIDFGSAQTISPEAKVPSPLNAHWAAPELYQTEQPITVQSDVWGLGIIAFCLLSGFHPFSSEGDTDIEIKESVLHEKCNPNLIFVQASQESLRFVTWALKKNPLRRMRTGEALTHRWLSNDSSMVRRRETIKYPSSRLQKTVLFTAAPTNTTLSPALAAIVPK